MAFFTFSEIFNLIVLMFTMGYIFLGYVRDPNSKYLDKLSRKDFLFSLLVSAPGVILHELAHKFVAIAFGLTASFFVFWWGLGIAIFLKLIHSPFIIIAPGYVGISGTATELQSILTSFAGPLVNIILFFVATLILNNAKRLTRRQAVTLYLTKKINLFLFIFNMLPIPPLDGSKVLFGIFRIIFSSF